MPKLKSSSWLEWQWYLITQTGEKNQKSSDWSTTRRQMEGNKNPNSPFSTNWAKKQISNDFLWNSNSPPAELTREGKEGLMMEWRTADGWKENMVRRMWMLMMMSASPGLCQRGRKEREPWSRLTNHPWKQRETQSWVQRLASGTGRRN